MIEMKEFGSCDIFRCLFSVRHHTDDNEAKTVDELCNFYTKILDSLHFYLLHLYQCGLRTQKQNEDDIKNGDTDHGDDEYFHQEFARVSRLIQAEAHHDDDKCFDKEFSRISRLIQERQHITTTFNRFKNNTKFSLIHQNEEQDESKTFMDELYSYLSRIQQVRQDLLSKFAKYIVDAQYDTDSLQMDVNFSVEGNIVFNINSIQLIEAVTEFINATKLKSTSFNIGIIFYYWPKYKGMKEFGQNGNRYNINDHGGYKFVDLYVPQKFSIFKEEISDYKCFSMVQYKALMVKINEYLKTETVKSTKARQVEEDAIQLQYEVDDDTILSYYHLLCVLLYTDYTELSNDFCCSFHGIYPFEPVSSIKKRHQTYWWMAKGLREIVQLF
eukprot:445653_1